MEIMQQQGSSPLDGRWRGHVPLPYAAHGMALPTLNPLRQHQQQHHQQQQQQQQQRPHHHMQQQQQHPLHPQQQQQEQQQHQLQLQQQLQQQHRHLLKQSRPQLAEAGSSRDHHSQPSSSSSSSSSSSHSHHASPQPSPHAPAPGKSGGTKEEGEKKEGGEWEQYNAGAAFLGPTLWDKTISYDSDLKLEYMDLDEFLNENGIPIDEAAKAMRGGGGGVGAHAGGAAKGVDSTTGGATDLTSPTASVSPEAASPSSPDGTPMGLGVVPQGPPPPVTHPALPQATVPAPATPAPPPPHSAPPPCLSPDDLGDEYCSSDSGSPHSPALQVHEGDAVRASLGRDSTNKVRGGGGEGCEGGGGIMGHSSLSARKPIKGEHFGLSIDFEVSPNDLALATVPGQDFDPRTRCFSEEELKPQPMIKKSRKQFVPVEMKDEKYWARRRKNNMAAKRSRDARRLKENQIAMRANFLEKENDVLTSELQKAQAVVEALKKRLAVYEVV